MRFTCDRNELAQAVTSVAQGLPARPRHPSHLGMLVHAVEMVYLTASDGDNTFSGLCDSDVWQEGSFIFPRVFPEVIRSLTGETVEILVEGSQGVVTCGRSRFTFALQDGKDYPFPLTMVPDLGEVDGGEFRSALRSVLPAVGRDNPVPALTAVLLQAGETVQGMQLVATDKYALACAELWAGVGNFKGTALLPGRWAERIARMDGEKMTIGWDDNKIGVRSGGTTITCRQIEGQFPGSWDRMLSSPSEKWTVLPDGLADVVKRAALTLGDKEAVTLSFGGELTVSTQGSKGGFSEALPVDHRGESVTLKAGVKLLLDALACSDGVLVEPGRPLLFRGQNTRYLIQVRRENAQA